MSQEKSFGNSGLSSLAESEGCTFVAQGKPTRKLYLDEIGNLIFFFFFCVNFMCTIDVCNCLSILQRSCFINPEKDVLGIVEIRCCVFLIFGVLFFLSCFVFFFK